MAETTARAILKYYDKDGNGYLEPIEVLQFISDLAPQLDSSKGAIKPEVLSNNLLRIADENGDNKISLPELI